MQGAQEQKDDGTICTIGGKDREGEWQREGETSTCLMVIGDITYTNNEAEDDNIFCMTSVFVKAVLTQRNGTLNHPHAPDMYTQWHAQTHLNTHARTRDFTSHFPARCHIKYAITRGEEGHFVWWVYALFVNQYTSTQRRDINAGVRIRGMSTSNTGETLIERTLLSLLCSLLSPSSLTISLCLAQT